MSIRIVCECGRGLKARNEFAGKRANCPDCGQILKIPEQSPPAEPTADKQSAAEQFVSDSMPIEEFLDPPTEPISKPTTPEEPILRRMFEALLDPRSIQWMLMIGGGLLVLGVIVLLVNLLDIEAPNIIATSMCAGTLVVMAGGWYMSLKTDYKVAGRAMTFLACVVAPLNLWYFHAQEIVTVDNHLWMGGVICTLIYIATVRVLRDPLFLYAFEVGITLTCLLFLPIVDVPLDAPTLSILFIVLAGLSIHAERAFAPGEGEFNRQRYGMPLFWSGQFQVGVGLLILLGSQVLGWLNEPIAEIFGRGFDGNLLTDKPLVAGLLWLAGSYLYLYSDLVVRRIGIYLYVAAFSLLMSIVTIVGWQFDSPEAVIIVLSLVGLAANLAQKTLASKEDTLVRVTAPLGFILSGLPLFIGWVLHLRANNAELFGTTQLEWLFVIAMLVAVVCNRVSAFLVKERSLQQTAVYLFFSAAGLLLAAAGLLPLIGFEEWYQQAPLLMLIPIGYILGARFWRGSSYERPLGWIAHTATGIIMFHLLVTAGSDFKVVFRPLAQETSSLLVGLAFAEAALFYALAGLFRRRGVNAYFAAAAACGAMWQWMGYFDVSGHYHTSIYALLGIAGLGLSRVLGIEQVTVYNHSGDESVAMQGRGRTAFQSGTAILSIALLSAFWQGVMRLIEGGTDWTENSLLILTSAISCVAIGVAPQGLWKRVYCTAAVALASLTAITVSIDWLKTLSMGEKVELISVSIGILLLIASYIARFRDRESKNEMVDFGLLLGSFLATLPLLIAVVYHRWWGAELSMRDEIALLAVTTLMLITGLSWQTRFPTLLGGGCLSLYLIVLITELARRAEEIMGVAIFMTIVGAVLFGCGLLLSMYRERLLKLPDRIANREGIFEILTWR